MSAEATLEQRLSVEAIHEAMCLLMLNWLDYRI